MSILQPSGEQQTPSARQTPMEQRWPPRIAWDCSAAHWLMTAGVPTRQPILGPQQTVLPTHRPSSPGPQRRQSGSLAAGRSDRLPPLGQLVMRQLWTRQAAARRMTARCMAAVGLGLCLLHRPSSIYTRRGITSPHLINKSLSAASQGALSYASLIIHWLPVAEY